MQFLEVDVPALEKKLVSLGAEKVDTYDYSRAIFDYPDFRLNKADSWMKLRTDGKTVTLSYKQVIKDASSVDVGMKEIEIIVSDYEKTKELLLAIGLVIKREEKNKRVRYKKEDTAFDIDFWPQVPPYVEIESSSMERVKYFARELGFDPNEGMIAGPAKIYKKYGYNLEEYSSVTFDGMIKK